jgi:Ca2+-binding RTX toxin-like protein
MATLIWNGNEGDETYTAPLDAFNEYDAAELRGFGGDDRITGLTNDPNLIDGGSGDDTLIGGTRQNTLEGGEGSDLLDGSRGSSGRLYGGAGNDLLIGSSAGGSTLDGGEGADIMVGGKGLNVYYVDSAGDVVVETYVTMPGDPPNPMDLVRATVSFTLSENVESLFLVGDAAIAGTGNNLGNLIDGNSAANTLAGGKGNDTLLGSSGDDSLSGGAGHDTVNGESGTDTVAGDTGDDVLRVDAATDVVVELAAGGSDTVQASATYTLAEGVHVELLQLTGSAAIHATGNSFDNLVAGNTGNNSLIGGGGFDTLSYALAAGAVAVNLATGLATGQGNDTVSGFGRVFGSNFADTLDGSAAADVLNGGIGADLLRGGAGADLYVVDNVGDVIVDTGSAAGELDLVEAQISWTLGAGLERLQLLGTVASGTGNTLANHLLGNASANSLSGSSGDDTLDGGSGSDTLTGGSGADSMLGGGSSDRYSVDQLGDIVVEELGAGSSDTAVVSVNGWTLAANVENLELAGGATSGTGNGLANRLKGTSGNDTLDGGLGNDTLDGGNGNDVYLVGSASDVVSELFTSTGTDEVRSTVSYTLTSAQIERLTLLGSANLSGTGSSANNLLNGNTGSNSLAGGSGNDTLNGGDGNDTLRGGTGSDSIVGGAGADVVQLDGTSGSDRVTGFVSGSDDMRLATATLAIGDGDTLVESATTRSSPGLFGKSAELVVFTSNIVGSITTSNAAAKIGSATSAYAVGDARLFVVDNGTDTAVFRFVAADADAAVEAAELTLLATLAGTASTTIGDYLFGG